MNLRKTLAAVAVAAAAFSSSSCLAGPHQLRRSIDDWDQKVYVNSPWLSGALWIVPVIPALTLVAATGDLLITDPYAFWFDDAWDGTGTGFKHHVTDATDGKMGSLLDNGSAWTKVQDVHR